MPRVPAVAPLRCTLDRAGRAVAAALVVACLARAAGAQQVRELSDIEARPNLLALFVGGTSTSTTIHLSVGADYERRLDERWGVGGFADWVLGGEGREFLLAPAVFWHPVDALRLAVGPGVQRNKADDETLFIVRLGAGYEIGVSDRWSISPGVALDLVEGDVTSIFVFGASLGYRF